MSCDLCGGDPVVMSVMDTIEYDTQAVCGDCVPGWALALAVQANPGLLDEDGRHKYVLAIPDGLHDTARELYESEVVGRGEASTPPGGPGLAEPSAGGSADDTGPATAEPEPGADEQNDADAAGDQVDGDQLPDDVADGHE